MREVVRDPNRLFLCPRCGLPVTYKGRGRRPVWCSARCRVEASIERRGNRVVGVEPEVVRVLPPTQRVSEWEQSQRRRLEETMTKDVVVDMVGTNAYLLGKVLEKTRDHAVSLPEPHRKYLASALTATAHQLAPTVTPSGVPAEGRTAGRRKRDAAEWAELLAELATQLGNGQLYSRDLPIIDEPLGEVFDRYMRRRGEGH